MGYLPDFHDSSIPAVKLLQGAIYADDTKAWDLLLTHRVSIAELFCAGGISVSGG